VADPVPPAQPERPRQLRERLDRFEMRLASHRRVERFEALGGMEQQGRSVAAAGARERDLRAQAFQPRALKLVERGKLGGRQQLERRVRCRSVELGLRGGQGPPAPFRRIRSQLRRVRQERRRRRCASTCLRPVGRALQLGGHVLVDPHRRVCTMPCSTIGIGIRIGRIRQCPMRRSPLGKGGRPVHRGSHEWMPEADTGSDLDQLRIFRRGKRAAVDAELVSRAPDERRVANRLGRRQQEQSLCCLRQFADALEIVILEMAREVSRSDELEAPRQLRRADAPRQIEQSERVAAGFRDDAVADVVVEPTRDGSAEQGARILLGEATHQQLGEAVEVVPGIRLADGGHHRDRLGQQPPRDEADDHS
jgi:hypothetical protein